MRSLALDPTSGDFAFTASRSLALVSGADALAQRLRGRLRLWLGEWFGDTSIGIPWLQMLGTKDAQAYAEATLRRVVSSCPGVAAVESFDFAFDGATRSAQVGFRARTADGTVVEDNGFRVGA